MAGGAFLRTLSARSALPCSISEISFGIPMRASPKRSSSALGSLSVASIISAPETAHDLVVAEKSTASGRAAVGAGGVVGVGAGGGDAGGRVEVEVGDIGADEAGAGEADLGGHVGAVHVDLAAGVVDEFADLADAVRELAVGGGVGDHEA